MGIEIKTWQIVDGGLRAVTTTLKRENRTEPYDLEPWIQANPAILGPDIAIIGRQTRSKSGPIDLLGIDKSGNIVIVELKRDKLPREALAQAIDYASDAAEWSIDVIEKICVESSGKPLEVIMTEYFPDLDFENLVVNETQRIILIGFSIESSLERMIEWLSGNFSVNINAILLNYVKTSHGDELLTRTSIISEELEQERVTRRKKFQILMSDDPGTHAPDRLRELLQDYLSRPGLTNQRFRHVLLPALLAQETLTREQLKMELLKYDSSLDLAKVGLSMSPMSSQLGLMKNDFLRQIIGYDYPNNPWEKDNFTLRGEFRDLVRGVLEEIRATLPRKA